MNKYCVFVEKRIYEKVMVYAKISDVAVEKVKAACEQGQVDFSQPIDEQFLCEIDLDSVKDDGTDTFDDENYSDVGTQVIK